MSASWPNTLRPPFWATGGGDTDGSILSDGKSTAQGPITVRKRPWTRRPRTPAGHCPPAKGRVCSTGWFSSTTITGLRIRPSTAWNGGPGRSGTGEGGEHERNKADRPGGDVDAVRRRGRPGRARGRLRIRAGTPSPARKPNGKRPRRTRPRRTRTRTRRSGPSSSSWITSSSTSSSMRGISMSPIWTSSRRNFFQ